MNLFIRTYGVLQSAKRALSPRCGEAIRLQSEALDHSLPPAYRMGLMLHLLLCKGCRRYGTHLCFLTKAAQTSANPLNDNLPGGLPPEARRRILKRLSECL